MEKIEIELHGPIAGEVVEFILNFAVFVDNELCARNIEQKGDGWVSAEFKKDQMEVLLAGLGEVSRLATRICEHLEAKVERGEFLLKEPE